jgi:hypothetical protein
MGFFAWEELFKFSRFLTRSNMIDADMGGARPISEDLCCSISE